MKYSQARQGRIFVIRLEDGDIIHEEIERLARMEKIPAAAVIILGGADRNSRLIVGPENGRAPAIVPMETILENVSEIAGTGTIFPDEGGDPILHMHIACGRENATVTGCVRNGVKVWQVMEAVLFEIIESTGVRLHDPATGFKLLNP
ncbi:MAG: DNA-binding protein [Syntrophales bacterium]|jgi:predicted DNA-binding protein with PD1-like motif|nr:DNA-binding protein [Syntrophales bacterium]MDY0043454.1 DNA-binding protein [Syntrophales bacterium]